MSELYRMLGQSGIDDDYLTGLTNKGIVKRAYKDIETADIKICDETEDGLTVTVDDVTCKLVMPLGESTCSCPSRSMCRHIITAFLYVKREFESEPEEVKQDENMSCSERTREAGELSTSAEKQTEDFSELLDYPLSTIKKQVGMNSFRTIYEHLIMENHAVITETSIVTVELENQGVKVKLLAPIEYSTCSCGRKEFCVHRAEAILRYQIYKEKISIENIAELIMSEGEEKLNKDGIITLAENIKQMLEEMISAGLARLSPELVSGCERFAIMCHNERLADFEKDFRTLSEQLRLYFGRHASFRIEKLLSDVIKLYGEANHIVHITDDREIYKLTERMRTEYVPSKPLDLVGMGYRHFKSQTGYEGEVIYFLEENTGKWYTYTNARPLYYEGKRAVRITGKEAAPWGLDCSMQELAQSRIHLSGCRVNQDNRLSSTSEAKAEIVGARAFTFDGVEKNSYNNFSQLFSEKFPTNASVWERNGYEQLVFIYPYKISEAFFDSVRQRFLMMLEDAWGNRIQAHIDYSNEESYNIKYLERLYQQIEKKKKKPACFFGKVYISEGMLKLYPIEYYEEQTTKADIFLSRKNVGKKKEQNGHTEEDKSANNMDNPEVEGLKDCLENCRNLMTQILQSGFTTVQAQTIEDIRRVQTTVLQYGLHYGGEMLGRLAEELEKRKHDMTIQGSEELVATFVRLNLYIIEALSKVKYDEVAWKFGHYEK
ncbi:MAG: SWIM zinc finger family protein [Lachnospiraceae bacterium]|nr:SWIM zinc finger family protein [Lachnospiraceae bacterium]